MARTIEVTDEQYEALEWALQIAGDDQESYLAGGYAAKDYGNDGLIEKAATLRLVRDVAEALGMVTIKEQFEACAVEAQSCSEEGV